MLTEQRFDIILKLLEERKSVTVTELRELLDASESTVRRDITALDKAGKLTKVFGGAVALNHKVTAYEPTVAQKSELNKEEKQKIARYAASLIAADDFVYLDAGTTTGLMLEYLAGCRSRLCHQCGIPRPDSGKDGNPGLSDRRGTEEFHRGSRRQSGDADDPDVSFHERDFSERMGSRRREGFTTPDTSEAIVKGTAMKQCRDVYVLDGWV